MERNRVTELHYIAHVENLESIMTRGLLSHRRAARVPHVSVASEAVQDLRRGKDLPRGRQLHDHVNLYFHARNAMMRRICDDYDDLVVLRIHHEALDIPDSVITDGNAANGPTAFYPSPGGLTNLDEERVYARWWTDPDPWVQQEKKRQRQAEVLVPDRVPPEYIFGCRVRRAGQLEPCSSLAPELEIEVNSDVFFG